MTTDSQTGVWEYSLALAHSLGEHGVRVSLAPVGAPPSKRQEEDATSIANVSLAEGAGKGISDEWLLFLENKLAPDVVHLNSPEHALLPWRTPYLLTVHDCPLTRFQTLNQCVVPGEVRKKAAETKQAVESASMVVCTTGAMLREIEQRHGPLENASAVYTGVNPGGYNGSARREMILVGGPADVASMASEIMENVGWPVFYAGEARGPSVQATGKLTRNAQKAWYSRSTIYAHIAQYEPFPLPTLEAAMSGCALVLSDTPAMRELWDGCAIFVPIHRSDFWTAAVTSLIEDVPGREYLALKAMHRAEAYTTRSMSANYLFAYQELLQTASLDVIRPIEGFTWR